MRLFMCKKLKTKSFSRLTEAFCLIGGGENRTLVLSKLHNNDYMLSVLFYSVNLVVRHPTRDSHTSFHLETQALEIKIKCSYQDL